MTTDLAQLTSQEREKITAQMVKDRERQHTYRQTHKEEHKTYGRQYNLKHRERLHELQLQYRQKHKVEKAEYRHQYNLKQGEEYKEKANERSRRHYREKPEMHKNAERKRRALLAGSNGNFTTEEFELLCKAFGNKCTYCSQELPLVPDHAIPLSKGGSNSIENIVPACEACNKRKYTMTYDEYMEQLSKVVQ